MTTRGRILKYARSYLLHQKVSIKASFHRNRKFRNVVKPEYPNMTHCVGVQTPSVNSGPDLQTKVDGGGWSGIGQGADWLAVKGPYCPHPWPSPPAPTRVDPDHLSIGPPCCLGYV